MTLETVLIVVAIVLFGSAFLGLFLSYQQAEKERGTAAAAPGTPETRPFSGSSSRDAEQAEERIVRQIEDHPRGREEALRADEQSRLEAA